MIPGSNQTWVDVAITLVVALVGGWFSYWLDVRASKGVPKLEIGRKVTIRVKQRVYETHHHYYDGKPRGTGTPPGWAGADPLLVIVGLGLAAMVAVRLFAQVRPLILGWAWKLVWLGSAAVAGAVAAEWRREKRISWAGVWSVAGWTAWAYLLWTFEHPAGFAGYEAYLDNVRKGGVGAVGFEQPAWLALYQAFAAALLGVVAALLLWQSVIVITWPVLARVWPSAAKWTEWAYGMNTLKLQAAFTAMAWLFGSGHLVLWIAKLRIKVP